MYTEGSSTTELHMPRPVKYPFITMEPGEETSVRGTPHLVLGAMYNTGHRKGWHFAHDIVAAHPDGTITIKVRRIMPPEGYIPRMPANIKDRRRLGCELAPELLPGATMPARFKGEYPYLRLRVGNTYTATPAKMNLIAMIRMAQSAQSASTRTAKKYSVSRVCDELGMLQEVRITRTA